MSVLPVTIFFDFTCPFSYVAMAALHERAAAGEVEVRARSVERFPAPSPLPAPADEADALGEMASRARDLGLALRPPDRRPRTRKAHEAAAFAAQRGLAAEMRAAVFAAYWGGGRDIGRIDVLAELGAGLELDPEDLRIALDIDQFREPVLHDQEVAARLRIARTPTLFFGSGPDAAIQVGALGREELREAIIRYQR